MHVIDDIMISQVMKYLIFEVLDYLLVVPNAKFKLVIFFASIFMAIVKQSSFDCYRGAPEYRK